MCPCAGFMSFNTSQQPRTWRQAEWCQRSHLECTIPSWGILRHRRRTTKPFSVRLACFAAPQLFIERTCSEEPAKGNKQRRGGITGLKDVFPASSEPSFRTQPSASLSHPDYITRNPGLWHRLEPRGYFLFQSRALILVPCSFPCPWCARQHQSDCTPSCCV